MRALIGITIVAVVLLGGWIPAPAAEVPSAPLVSPALDTSQEATEEAAAEHAETATRGRMRGNQGSGASRVDRAKADAFTAQFNRQELENMQSGGSRPRWRELSPPPQVGSGIARPLCPNPAD